MSSAAATTPHVVEDRVLSTRTEHSTELSQTAIATEKQQEVQGAIVVAKRFPRNEDQAFERLMKACKRPSFAEDAAYSFKRGRRQDENGNWVDNYVTGPSVYLAREAKRVWGNIQSGVEIVRDDPTSRKIRAWAWDLETNVKEFAEDEFQKLIQRKVGKGKDAKTEWVTPDERDLRELTNRRAAVIERNCILQTLPPDLIGDALAMAEETIRRKVTEDPEGARKRIILSFSEINVTPEMLERKLGHPVAQSSPNEITELRKIYKSIIDGNSSWADYANGADEEKLGEVTRKSESAPPADAPPPTAPAAAQSAADLPIDLSKQHHIEEVTAPAKKGGAFTVKLRDVASVLSCTDQRLYIAAQSAKQSGAGVIVQAKSVDGALTLTGLEEMEG